MRGRALRLDEHERNTARTVGVAEDERRRLRKDGSRFWSTGMSVPICRQAAAVTGFVKVFRDATYVRTRMSYLENRVRESRSFSPRPSRTDGRARRKLRPHRRSALGACDNSPVRRPVALERALAKALPSIRRLP